MPSATFDPNAPDPRRRRRRWPKFAALAVLLALIVAGLWPRPLPVETAVATIGDLRVTVDEDGRTRVRNRYTLSAPVSGQLIRPPFKAGAPVEAGKTVLAAFETAAAAPLDARARAQAEARVQAAVNARDQAQARLRAAGTTGELAATELRRARELADRDVISAQELDTAVAREATAREELRAAEFGLNIATFELAQAEALLGGHATEDGGAPLLALTAPVGGRVLRVFEESARLVPMGAPLVEIGDPADLEVVIEVLSRDAVAIQPGADVFLDHWGGDEPLRARVRLVEPAGFTKISALGVEEQRVNVIADITDPVELRPTLGDGYRVEARVVTAKAKGVLTVPGGALFQQAGRWRCYVVADGRAELRDVTPGYSNGLTIEIREGLAEGDEVIVYPGDKLSDGARVETLRVDNTR